MSRWRIAGINFDHFHMGDNLRFAFQHPDCEIVGICDEQPQRMADAIQNFQVTEERVFSDYRHCLEATRPDIVILCPASARHGQWTQQVAPFGVHLIIEKPFAATLPEADAMIAAMAPTGKQMAINWPLAWYPSHRTTKRLIDEGAIGQVIEVHFYDGNRGPLWHAADKLERTSEQVAKEKPNSWFYKRQHGGGSLLDYLGYGTTLGTWFLDGAKPLEVTAVVDEPAGLEVDEHAIVIAATARDSPSSRHDGGPLPIPGHINHNPNVDSWWSARRGPSAVTTMMPRYESRTPPTRKDATYRSTCSRRRIKIRSPI